MIYLRFWDFLPVLGSLAGPGPIFLYWGVEKGCKEQNVKIWKKKVNIYPIQWFILDFGTFCQIWDFSWPGAEFFVLRGWKWLQGRTYQKILENV